MTDEPDRPPAPDHDFLATLQAVGGGPLGDRMGIELLEATRERVVGRMPVEGNTQPYGILHGGASAVLAESLGSIGAVIHGAPDRYPVGIELSCSHHRSASAGTVTGIAVPITSGRTLSTWEIIISDDEGRRLCTARLTCLLRDIP